MLHSRNVETSMCGQIMLEPLASTCLYEGRATNVESTLTHASGIKVVSRKHLHARPRTFVVTSVHHGTAFHMRMPLHAMVAAAILAVSDICSRDGASLVSRDGPWRLVALLTWATFSFLASNTHAA